METLSIYSKGEPVDLSKHIWYHGSVTKEQAVEELPSMKKDAFLVRQDGSHLILSTITGRTIAHKKIYHKPEGYRLEGKDEQFSSIPEMIAHYQQLPINDKVLGEECHKLFLGMLLALGFW